MPIVKGLDGTDQQRFQIGLSGPAVKANGGAVEVRNNTDAGLAVARAADPVGADDLATKRYVDGGAAGAQELAPLGTGADDWPRLMAAVAVAVGKGVPLIMLPGTWNALSQVPTPSNAHIIMSPGVRIVQAINTPSVLDAAFNGQATFGAATALAALVAVGAKTLTVTANPPAVGTQFVLADTANTSALYTAAVVAGNVVTLDRPALASYAVATTTLTKLTAVPTDITIEGNGAAITGSGFAYVNFAESLRVKVSGLRADTSSASINQVGGILFSFDSACYDCSFSDIVADHRGGSANAITCFGAENAERILFDRCIARNITAGSSSGFQAIESQDCVWTRCEASNCRNGFQWGSEAASTGCTECRLEDSTFVGNVSNGVDIRGGSARNVVKGCVASYNGNVGMVAGAQGSASVDTAFVGCVCENNAVDNFLVALTVKGTTFAGCHTSGSVAGAGVDCLDEATITGHESNKDAIGILASGVVAIVRVDGYRVDVNVSSGMQILAGARAKVTGAEINFSAAGLFGFYCDNGKLDLDRAVAKGPNVGTANGVFATATATTVVRIGPEVDLSACGTPLSLDATTDAAPAPLGGVTAFAWPADANQTLTPAQFMNNTIELTGGALTATRDLALPSAALVGQRGRIFFVRNDTTGTIAPQAVRVGGAGGVTIANPAGAWLRIDSTGAIKRVTLDSV